MLKHETHNNSCCNIHGWCLSHVYSLDVSLTTQNDVLAREIQLLHLGTMKNDVIVQYQPNSVFVEELVLTQDEDGALRS
jgi:hypothetical protein